MKTAPTALSRDDAVELLLGRINYERTGFKQGEIRLDRMRNLLARIGDPHLAWPALHIAGTKGKGSTAAMAASILTSAGYRTGLYTSPHLNRIEERVSVDGEICPGDDFAGLAAEVWPHVETMDREFAAGDTCAGRLTFFEITTAMAMLHFARRKVDIAVLEVGLGGRLDSTNVCRPAVCAITSISYDHTKQLGRTLREIAAEKAGVIKPGAAVVSGVLRSQPRQVVEQVARDHGCRLLQIGRDFTFEQCNVTAQNGELFPPPGLHFRPLTEEAGQPLDNLRLQMRGRGQAANAAVAIASVRCLTKAGFDVADEAIRDGLAAAWRPARIELLAPQPPTVIDVAHNPASMKMLAETLQATFAEAVRQRSGTLIFAASSDKDIRGMLRVAAPCFGRIIVTQYVENPRSADAAQIAELARRMGDEMTPDDPWAIETAPNPTAAWRRALAERGEELVCIAGSFYLAAEMRDMIAGEVGADAKLFDTHHSPR